MGAVDEVLEGFGVTRKSGFLVDGLTGRERLAQVLHGVSHGAGSVGGVAPVASCSAEFLVGIEAAGGAENLRVGAVEGALTAPLTPPMMMYWGFMCGSLDCLNGLDDEVLISENDALLLLQGVGLQGKVEAAFFIVFFGLDERGEDL